MRTSGSGGGSGSSSGSAPPSPGPMVRVTPTLLFRHESLTHVGKELHDKFTVTNTAKDRITVNVFRTLRSHKYTLDFEPSTAKIKPVCQGWCCSHLAALSVVFINARTHRDTHKPSRCGSLCTAPPCWSCRSTST